MRRRQLAILGAMAMLGGSMLLTPRPMPAAPSPISIRSDTDSIAVIRARYARINRDLSKYRRTRHDLEGFSVEGGVLTGYYEGDQLRLLASTHYGEGGKAEDKYYFWDGSLFFVYIVVDYYARPINVGPGDSVPPRTPRHFEDRFYFVHGKLVRWVDSAGHQRSLSDTAAISWEEELRASALLFSRCAGSSAADALACSDTTH